MGRMATLQGQLDEAIAARHAWKTGKARTTFRHGDRTIEYSVEGMKQLDSYIAQLRRQISGVQTGRARVTYAVPD